MIQVLEKKLDSVQAMMPDKLKMNEDMLQIKKISRAVIELCEIRQTKKRLTVRNMI